MTIKMKLILLSLAGIVASLLVGGLGLWGMSSNVQAVNSLYNDRVVPLRDLKQIADNYAVNVVDASHKLRNGNISWAEASKNIADAQKLIPKVIARALAGEEIPVYGKGLQSRDWIHVDDHVRALYLVATQGQLGKSYAISAQYECQNIDLVKRICAILEKLSPSEANPNIDSYSCQPGNADSYIALIKFVPDRAGHDQRYALNASKLQQQLGWQAEIDFDAGLEATVAGYLS